MTAAPLPPRGFPAASSPYTYIEKLEYWPELDPSGAASTAAMSYPSPRHGTVVGAAGEPFPAEGAVDRFQHDRRTGRSAWSVGRWGEGGEVFDVIVASAAGEFSVTLPGSVVGMDLSPDGGRLAVLSWDDGPALQVLPTDTLQPQVVLRLDRYDLSGGEPIRFSGDGRYLLINIARTDAASVLVDTTDGTTALLPWAGAASWRPGISPGRVLLAEIRDGRTFLRAGDLVDGSVSDLGWLTFPPGLKLQDGETKAFDFEIGPDGDQFLARAYYGSRAETDAPIGGRPKLVSGSLGGAPDVPRVKGTLAAATPTVGGSVEATASRWWWEGMPALEFHHVDVRWCDRAPGAPIALHPDVQGRFTPGQFANPTTSAPSAPASASAPAPASAPVTATPAPAPAPAPTPPLPPPPPALTLPPPPGASPPPPPPPSVPVHLFAEVDFRPGAPPPPPGSPAVAPDGTLVLAPGEQVLFQLSGDVGTFHYPWAGANASEVTRMPGTSYLVATNQRLVSMSPDFIDAEGRFYGADTTTITGDVLGGLATSLSERRARAKANQATAGRVVCAQVPSTALVGLELVDDEDGDGVRLVKATLLAGGKEHVLVLVTQGEAAADLYARLQWLVQHLAHDRASRLAGTLGPEETAHLEMLVAHATPDTSEGDPAWYIPGARDLLGG